MMALEDSEWQKADGFFEEVLNLNAECAEAYLGKLMAELQVTTPSGLANCPKPFDGLKNYQKAVRFGDKGLATELQGYINHINKRNENLRLSSIYRKAKGAMEKAQSEEDFLDAAKQFDTISSFQDAAALSLQCREKAEEARKDKIYDNACKLMRDEDFRQVERAIVAFESIPGWRDADEKIQKCTAKIEKRKAAIRAAEQRKKRVLSIIGKVTVVVAVVGIVVYCLLTFLILPLPHYRNAEELLSQGDIANAAIEYGNAGNYSGAKAKSLALWEQMDTSSIAAGSYHTVALKNDGSVIAIGRNDNNQCDVAQWKNVVSISAGSSHTVALLKDGTVVATGSNTAGQCNVEDWTDIIAVSAGNSHTVGLKSDGTVVAVGKNSAGQCDVDDWTDIVAISANGSHTVGLKSDGSVVAVGSNSSGQCDVDDWTDIVAISAGASYTVGLKSDGTVVAVVNDSSSQCDVDDWTDIVAVSAAYSHTIGLKSDGTVVAVGSDNSEQCDVDDWKDIVAVSAGEFHTVGLKSDGTVVAVGSNTSDQCDVEDWTNIRVPG
jgi:alpha-tubulin suppressor-like RCC1 family protein